MREVGYLEELLLEAGLSDFAARTLAFVLVRPLKIVLLVVVGAVLSRLAGRAARRFVRSVHTRSPLRPVSPRAEQRAATIGDALAAFVRVAVWGVVVLLVLDQLGLNLAPLLAGAGVAGLAVGFGAQTLVRDVISGLFVLAEDQYGIGDVVTLGDATGTVEDINLRVTRLRAADGTVWFVPNGEVRKVGNASMEWSRAVLDVKVPADADVGRASAVLVEEVAAAGFDAPEVWAVPTDGDALTLRTAVRTRPGEQWHAARDLRSRVADRLQREGIAGAGDRVVVSAGALDQALPPISISEA